MRKMRKATVTIAATIISIAVLVGIAVAVSDFHDDGASTDKGFLMGPNVTGSDNTFGGYFDFWESDSQTNQGLIIRSRDGSDFRAEAGDPQSNLWLRGDVAGLMNHENKSMLATLCDSSPISWVESYGTCDPSVGGIQLYTNRGQVLDFDVDDDFRITGPSTAELKADTDGTLSMTSSAGAVVSANADGNVVVTLGGGESSSMQARASAVSSEAASVAETRAAHIEATRQLLESLED